MRRLNWRDSATAVEPARIRVERFCGRTRRRVHLLGDVRCIKTHHKVNENTAPCLAPDEPCSLCADPAWKPRLEHFAPALIMDERGGMWVPIVAVFTPGGRKKLDRKGGGAHRGRLLDVWRAAKGNAQGGVLMVDELARIEPLMPAFDVEPHLLRMWFPDDEAVPPAEVPDPIPYVVQELAPPAAEPEPTRLNPETVAKFHSYAAKLRGEEPSAAAAPAPAEPPPTPAAPAEPTAPEPTREPVVPAPAAKWPRASMTPSPEKALEAVRRRAAERGLGSIDGELTELEAAFGRAGHEVSELVKDTVPASNPIHLNGKAKNGGAK